MTKLYIQEGEVIDHTAAAAISSGDVVLIGSLLGVAVADIAIGDIGAVAVRGVFEMPKASAAVIGAGETVNWDVSATNFDDNLATPAAGDLSGGCVAIEAAGAGVLTVKVAINVAPNTVT